MPMAVIHVVIRLEQPRQNTTASPGIDPDLAKHFLLYVRSKAMRQQADDEERAWQRPMLRLSGPEPTALAQSGPLRNDRFGMTGKSGAKLTFADFSGLGNVAVPSRHSNARCRISPTNSHSTGSVCNAACNPGRLDA